MTAQGSARTQYRRAIERRNLMGAEMALREIGSVTLLEALDYLVRFYEAASWCWASRVSVSASAGW